MIITYDCETTGLDWTKDVVLLSGYRLNRQGEVLCDQDALKTLVSNPDNILSGHNIKFDALFLANSGFDVTGIDIEPYNGSSRGYNLNYRHIADDFCMHNFNDEKFDIVISISTIEHLGIQYCVSNKDYDKIAIKSVWDILENGGIFYITVPISNPYQISQFYRLYDTSELKDRIIQKFTLISKDYFLSDNERWMDEIRGFGKYIPEEKALQYKDAISTISVGLKLKKVI